MATTTPEMGLTKPDPDGSSGVWDTQLNATIDVLDTHNHTSGLGVAIPVSGLDIDEDLPLGGFALSGAMALQFSAVAAGAVTSYSRALWASSDDNELYWRTSGGVNVQITSGTSLNSALVGGFTGDYGSPAEASYSSSTSIYNFLRAATHRANLDTADIRLFEGTLGVTNAVKIKSPAGLAASYDWIFPAALPGSTSIVCLSSTGVLTASNTIANALTLSATLTAAAINASGTVAAAGAVTVGTTLGVTGATTLAALSATTIAASGLITASAGLTGASNQHVTVQGAGIFKHGTRAKQVSIYGIQQVVGNESWDLWSNGYMSGLPVGTGSAFLSVPMQIGEQISGASFRVQDAVAESVTITLSVSNGSGTVTDLATITSTTGGAATHETLVLVEVASNLPHVVAVDEHVFFEITKSGDDADLRLYGGTVSYDQP